MFIIKYRKFFYVLSLVVIFLSLVLIINYGVRPGTDFTGGTIMTLNYSGNRPDKMLLEAALKSRTGIEALTVQTTGDTGFIIRMKAVTEEVHQNILAASTLDGQYQFEQTQYSSIGPTIGAELAERGITAIVLVVILIILYIAFTFRGVARPVSSWKYGIIAVVVLAHDILVSVGVFAWLGHTQGAEADALFLTALLTILGLSVNDTIVIFDRIRENLKHKISNSFEETVGISLNQTFTRSLISSLTVIAVLLAVYFVGGQTTRNFAFIMAVGMAVGTYSSIFLAAPLLVAWEKKQRK